MAASHSVTSESNQLSLEVEELTAMRARRRQHAVPILGVVEIAHRPRWVVSDPSGNELELTEIVDRYTPAHEATEAAVPRFACRR